MTANIVVGLGFGDEGKGLVTDFLLSEKRYSGLAPLIVVRYTGGHQAGHNVVIGDKSHIHSSYGSGTLRGVPSYFTEHCCMYPPNMMREYDVLMEKEVRPNLYLHPRVKVSTPYDVAYNRLLERRLGHGSCGIGIGTTMHRSAGPNKLFAVDLTCSSVVRQKLQAIKEYYEPLLWGCNAKELRAYRQDVQTEMGYFEFALGYLTFNIKPYGFLKLFNTVIFEGAQGVLLDMDFGVFPNVTYGHTTSRNAVEICKGLGIEQVEVYYVTRCYLTRHGTGWLPEGEEVSLINNESETNTENEWQGKFRTRELDYKLLDYAVQCDSTYSYGYLKNLVVTCFDQRPEFQFDLESLNSSFSRVYEGWSPSSTDLKQII